MGITRRLILLNGLAALMVPLHHAAAYGLQAMFLWTDRYRAVAVPNYDQLGTLPYYAIMVSRELHSFAVPAFLFVSGFFLAIMSKGSASRVNRNIVSQRIMALLPPFLLWTLFRFVLIGQIPSSIGDVLNPYWFIVLLIQYYLLSPWLVPWAKNHWQSLLVVAAVLQLFAQGLRYPYFLGIDLPGLELMLTLAPRWLFPTQLFNFALGVVVCLHLDSVQKWLPRVRWLLLLAVAASAVLMVVEYQLADRYVGEAWIGPSFTGLADNLYATSVCLCFLAFSHVRLPFAKSLTEIGSKSMGIYLANIPAIYVVAVAMYHLTPWALGNQIIYQAVLIAAGLGGPLLLMQIARRSRARPLYRYVFG
jgi:membrane-bound acyltransferase YfiQ involved in biofilm formation